MWALEYCKCCTWGKEEVWLDIRLTGVTYPSTCPWKVFLIWAQCLFSSFTMSFQCGSDTTRPLSNTDNSAGEVWTEREREKKEWELHIIMTGHMTGEDEGLRVRWHVRQTGEECEDLTVPTAHTHLKVKPWTSSPRPQLCAASLHPFLRVWHRPTSSMRWRAAGIMSFSFPKKKERRKRCERESWRCSTNKSG